MSHLSSSYHFVSSRKKMKKVVLVFEDKNELTNCVFLINLQPEITATVWQLFAIIWF